MVLDRSLRKVDMPPKTLAALEDLLDEGLGWRRAELIALEAEIEKCEKASPDGPLTRALVRGGIALLYAHWEGYTKEACEGYLDYVAIRRLRYNELCDGFVLTALLAMFRKAETGDDVAREALLEAVRRPEDARARMPRRSVVNTKSNLRYEVLVEICEAVGLPYDQFITRRQLIDRSLCDARNDIAHGRLVHSDADTFKGLRKSVVEMLESIRALIVRYARESLYRGQSLPSGA
ncbi:MAE_28990/MAE_18760 family HEPN-like nuclease [Amycolatopsis thailandensis]|uniref:MAE_28990/MAE_18760 family HEPN-like nuclease n=1 Tax=Amycolatopsis thailandensis TaxID=589330 RepID=UPI0037A1C181